MISSFCPDHKPQTIAIKLKPKAETYVKQGHPWIFESSIIKQSKEGAAGDIAIVFDQKRNKFLGIGLFDPFSPIRIKLLASGKQTKIDYFFFHDKIQDAYSRRKKLFKNGITGYRFLFGENDGLPGLILDIYSNVGVIKLYSSIWVPYLNLIVEIVLKSIRLDAIVIRLSRNLQKGNQPLFGLENGQLIFGKLEDPNIEFKEYGVKFVANVIKGHKTGYFLDHRANRHKVGQMSKGKSVLDVFSYAGGFSTHAAVGGAKEIVSIDISKHALELAKQNVKQNVKDANHKVMVSDAFDGMQQLINEDNHFDIVVVDPPSFATTSTDIEGAKKSYVRLAKLAIQLVKSDGFCVMASCSSRIDRDTFFELIEKGFDTSERTYRLMEKTFHDIDHPISFPEGGYLKTGYYSVI